MSAIRTENLRKDFGQVHAVDGLNLTVEPGMIFGFLGPNGAGKTNDDPLAHRVGQTQRG